MHTRQNSDSLCRMVGAPLPILQLEKLTVSGARTKLSVISDTLSSTSKFTCSSSIKFYL
jgi:hypothetical protein